MVLKRSKLGRNTGNSFYSFCYRHHVNCHGCVAKFLLNHNFTVEERNKAARIAMKYIQDGGLLSDNLQISEHFSNLYSLNKSKRWLLADLIKDAIDGGGLCHENLRVVFHERLLPQQEPVQNMIWDKLKMKNLDTVSYHDSRSVIPHSYAKSGKLSSLSDLKKVCHKYCSYSPKRPADVTVRQHLRGVQRVQCIPWFDSYRAFREEMPCTQDLLTGEFPFDDSVPEIRYEIWHSHPKLKCNERLYIDNHRIWRPKHHKLYHKETTCKFRRSKPPLIWKKTGVRNKPWAQFYFQGITQKECKDLVKSFLQEEEFWEKEEIQLEENLNKHVCELELTDDQNQDCASYLFNRDKQTHRTFSDYIYEPHGNVRDGFIELTKSKTKRGKRKKSKNSDYEKNIDKKGKIVYVDKNSPDILADTREVNDLSNQFSSIDETVQTFPDRYIIPERSSVLKIRTSLLEQRFSTCIILCKSVREFTSQYPERCQTTKFCRPQRCTISLGQEVRSGQLLLWKQEELVDQNRIAAKFWLRVHRSESVTKENFEPTPLGFVDTKVYTMQEVLHIAERILDHCVLRSPCVPQNLSAGVFESFCGTRYDVQSVHDAYEIFMSDDPSQRIDSQEEDSTLEMICNNPAVSSSPPFLQNCDICCNSLQHPVSQGTVLLPCQHFFCNECWEIYIADRISGALKQVTCPAYNCNASLEEITILSFVPCDLYNQWQTRVKESILEQSQIWKWCPNVKCQKVARIIKQGKFDTLKIVPVHCMCETSWCFSCQKDRHWPASCQQRDVYTKMLKQNGDEYGKAPSRIFTYFVDVKKCPKCRYPMQKNGGCQHMSCRCGHGFCWECGGDWTSHINNGLTCRSGTIHSQITMELEMSYPGPFHFYKKSVEHRFSWLKRLSLRVLQARCSRYAFKVQRRRMKSQSCDNIINNLMDMEAYSNLLHTLKFIRELHEILENIYVMMSHMTKKMRNQVIQGRIYQLEFYVEREEAILHEEEINPTGAFLDRSSKLKIAVYKVLKQIAEMVPDVQNSIAARQSKSNQLVPQFGRPMYINSQT